MRQHGGILRRTTPASLATSTATTLLLVLCSFSILRVASSSIACTSSVTCERLLYKGSICREDGTCSNPFEKGCLYTLLQDEFGSTTSSNDNNNRLVPSLAKRIWEGKIRVCNSDDVLPQAVEQGICRDSSDTALGENLYNAYTEVRILSQNWESAFFASWILQILLSEVLEVPATIETGTRDARLNFYSPTNDFGYGAANNLTGLSIANALPGADCRLLDNNNDEEYIPCGHVIPEFWAGSGRLKELWENNKEGVVDTPEGMGAIGHQGIFVPKFTAESDPSVLHLLGIGGESNRRKLAEKFLRPTTWQDYCEIVSETNCQTPDGVAQRPPTIEEYDRMHVEGLYTGYFRKTEKNDCDKYPTNCTGHVADYPCGWSSFLKAQTYHHNIALSSDGKEAGSNGYSYSQLVEIYTAANVTKSDVAMMWWSPEALYSTYLGTDAEMQRIVLPSPTQECIDHRVPMSLRCDYDPDNPLEQYGDPRGACDEAPQLLQEVVGMGLYEATYESNIPLAKQSPAYDTVKAFKMTELALSDILAKWKTRNIDTYGFDPRWATCLWVRDNLDYLEDFIPRTFPRFPQEENILESPLFYVSVSLGGIALGMTIITAIFTFRRRNGYVMRFSQVEFLFLLLLGLLLVSVGSILLAIPPQNASCIAIAWAVTLGYTLELVPLIVKVGAINRLMTAAKKHKRIVLSQWQLFGTVALFVMIMVIFLVLWSALDTPQRKADFTLTDEMTDYQEHIVTVNYYCRSDSDAWRYVAVVWHCILLLCATVLAFQTRNLQTGFSESSTLAMMIYSHFVFVLLRVVSFLMEGALTESYMSNVRSIIYSTDAIVTICIYFIPKLLTDDEQFYDLTHTPDKRRNGRGSGRGSVLTMNGTGTGNGTVNGAGYDHDEEDDDAAEEEALNKSNNTLSSRRQVRDDALGSQNKVSWGGACMTMFIQSDQEDDAEEKEQVPFQRPADVLKSKDSWGAAGVTMLLQSGKDSDDDSDTDDEKDKEGATQNGGRHTRLSALDETERSGTSRISLPTASLPKEHPPRFSYASSRINRMRDQYVSEKEEDSYRDEEDNV